MVDVTQEIKTEIENDPLYPNCINFSNSEIDIKEDIDKKDGMNIVDYKVEDHSNKKIDYDTEIFSEYIKNEIEVTEENIKIEKPNDKSEYFKSAQSCQRNNGTTLYTKTSLYTQPIYKKNLKKHVALVHEGNLYNCDQCNSKFTQKASLKRHFSSVHEGILYNCDQCNLTFTLKKSLKRHVLEIHEGITYNCDQCNFKFGRKESLTMHISLVHEGITYDCKLCIFKSSRKQTLNEHVSSVHKGIIYNCDQCICKFTDLRSLRRHVSSVHKGCTYDCKQCSFKSPYKHILGNHVVDVHDREKYKLGLLKNVSSVHIGIKTRQEGLVKLAPSTQVIYNCEQCNYKAFSKGDRLLHVSIVHGT